MGNELAYLGGWERWEMSLPTWEVGSDGKRACLPGRLGAMGNELAYLGGWERWEMSLPTWERW